MSARTYTAAGPRRRLRANPLGPLQRGGGQNFAGDIEFFEQARHHQSLIQRIVNPANAAPGFAASTVALTVRMLPASGDTVTARN